MKETTLMGNLLSPRVDEIAKLQPDFSPLAVDDRLARAEGLTLDEAQELATWLKQAGYGSVEIIHVAEHAAVVWQR
jgi:hypothetical protein